MACAPSEDSDQPGHPPSLNRVVAVCSMGSWGPNVSSYGIWRLWSDWADAQADQSIRWAHIPFCWFCNEAAFMFMYHKILNNSERLKKKSVIILKNYPKNWTTYFYKRIMCPKDADGMTNSIDPDQSDLVLSCLSRPVCPNNIGSLWYLLHFVSENVNRPKDFNLAKKNEMMMDRKVSVEIEPQHDKTNKMTCAPSKDTDQPGPPPYLSHCWAHRSFLFCHAPSQLQNQ